MAVTGMSPMVFEEAGMGEASSVLEIQTCSFLRITNILLHRFTSASLLHISLSGN